MNLSASTWNYLSAYGRDADTSAAVDEIINEGFGVEFWLGLGPCLDISDKEKKRLKKKLRGIKISAHSLLGAEYNSNYNFFIQEIALCASINIPVLVVHPDTIGLENDDGTFCKKVVDYATRQGVTIALENGRFDVLS